MKMFSKIGKLLLCGVAVAMIGCTDYDKDIQSVAGDVAQNATEIKNLENAISALEAKLASDYATKQELNAVKAALEGTIETEVAALQAAIADAVKDLASADDVAAVQAAVETLQAAAAEAKAAIEATDVKVENIDERLTAVETAIEAIDEVAEGVLADVESLKNGYMETVAFAQQASFAIEALTEQAVDLEGQIAAVEAMVDEMAGAFEDRINTLGQTIGNLSNLLNDEVAALQLADEEIYVKIGEVEGTITNVLALIEDLENEDEQIYQQLAEVLNTIGSVAALIEDEAAARANEDEQIYLQLNQTTQTLSSVIMTVADLETVVAEIEEALAAQVAAYEAYVEATDAKLNELKNQFVSLEPVIETLQAQTVELKNTLESLAPEFNAVKAQVKELQNTLLSLGEQLPEEIATIKAQALELKNQLVALEPVIEAIEAKIAGLQSELRSIVIIPGSEVVNFHSLKYIPMVEVTEDELDDTILTEEVEATEETEAIEFTTVAAPAKAYYHFNPSSFDAKAATYEVEEIVATKAVSKAYTATAANANGVVEVTYNYNAAEDMGAELVALKANLASGASIYSNYFAVSHSENLAAEIEIKLGANVLPATFEAAKDSKSLKNLSHYSPAKLGAPVAVLNGKTLDLAAYGFKFLYKAIPATHEYLDAKGVNMQGLISCKDAVKGEFSVNPVYDANDKASVNKAAIGKTPIVMVELLDANDNVVKRAYVKMTITVDRPHEYIATLEDETPFYTIEEGGKTSFSFDYQWLNDNVFELVKDYEGVQSITREQFLATYDFNKWYLSKGANHNQATFVTKNTVTIDEEAYVPYTVAVPHNEIINNKKLAYGETSPFVLSVCFQNADPTSSLPEWISLDVKFVGYREYDTTIEAKFTYAAQRVTFDLSADAIVKWAKALKDQPDTFNRIVEAAKFLADGQELNAIKALGGVPGFGVEEKVIVGVGRDDNKLVAAGAALTDWTEQYEALRKATEAKLNQSGSDLDNLRKAIKILELAAMLDSDLQSTVDTLNTLYNVLTVAANYTAKVPTSLTDLLALKDAISFEEITLYE